MSWDDEDFDIPSKAAPAAAASWEDEEDDEPLLEESWDVDEYEVKRKKAEAEAAKKAEKEALKKKQDEAKAKKLAGKNKGEPVLLDVDLMDEDARAEALKRAQMTSDLNNAADLFGGLGVAGDEEFDLTAHPRERAAAAKAPVQAPARMTKDTPIETHPVFQPTNKEEFVKLRKTLAPVLIDLAQDSLMNYSSGLAVDLIRDIAEPLSLENVRKVISTLNIVIKDKEKAERLARLKKAGGTATGGAGKKKAKPAVKTNVNSSFKKDVFEDMDDNFDNFGDDDFM
ncbi:eukaryotic translation initiation factor 3 subunit J [[Candida] anglica]|uniref:Eukaryotic translation initiation factor 3 subunit J n=1 Tax=[Candida] anglica TaxID=148631 RepID=A0ABP0EB74_9ASCO